MLISCCSKKGNGTHLLWPSPILSIIKQILQRGAESQELVLGESCASPKIYTMRLLQISAVKKKPYVSLITLPCGKGRVGGQLFIHIIHSSCFSNQCSSAPHLSKCSPVLAHLFSICTKKLATSSWREEAQRTSIGLVHMCQILPQKYGMWNAYWQVHSQAVIMHAWNFM